MKAVNFKSAGLTAAFLLSAAAAAFSVPPSDTDRIMKDLSSDAPEKQMQAKQDLRIYTFKDAADALEKYSKDPNPQMRILMAQMLGELGGFESEKILKKLFKKEKEASVRRAILIQLSGLLPDEKKSGEFFLKSAVQDDDPDNRLLALTQASLLSRTGAVARDLKAASAKVLLKDDTRRNRVLAAIILRELGEKGRKLSEIALEGLASPAVEVRRRAALVVGEVHGASAVEKVHAAARDQDLEVRANLCQSLSEMRDKAMIPVLKILAADPDSGIQTLAKTALAAMED